MNHSAWAVRALLATAAALLLHSIAYAGPPAGKGPGKDTGSSSMPPSVSITLPTSEPGLSTVADSVRFEAQVKSNSPLARVEWRSDRGPSGAAHADRGNRWTAGNVALADGLNVLTMTAIDVNGHSGSASVRVTRVLQQAQPVKPAPNPQAPVIGSVAAFADRVELAWSQSGDAPDGGYSVRSDTQAGTLLTTSATYATLTTLDTSMGHCLTVTAHYVALAQTLVSPAACTDPVTPPNTAPVITGAPSTAVEAGQAYAFTPDASDADGDALGFSISNKPAWASFDTVTGRLSGRPAESQTGIYAGIEIAVSDGYATTKLPAFSIEVTAPPAVSGSATLSWVAPTQREDGSALTDLAGYRIHYGRVGGAMTGTIVVDHPGVTTWVVEGLATGDWCFAITAVDSAGRESNYSNHAVKTIG